MDLCISDLDAGNLGANGIVGGGMGIAVCAAPSQQMHKTGIKFVCFFVEMVQPMKVFHEAENMASLSNLPVSFSSIINGYGISAEISRK